MRTFRFFFKTIFATLLGLGLIALIVPYIQLERAQKQLEEEFEFLTPAFNRTPHTRESCKNAEASSPFSIPLAYQLRFISDTEYKVELICTYVEDDPIEIRSSKLPLFVRKKPGTTGFYYGIGKNSPTSIEVQAILYSRALTLEGLKLEKQQIAHYNPLPKTVCSGYGYTCCEPGVFAGIGDRFDGSLDCSDNCFAACSPLPFIEAFNADPYPIDGQSIQMFAPIMDVTFSYAASSRGAKIAMVQIDYGDGTTEESTKISGIFTHQFSCSGPCRIPVTIRAIDATGKVSIENPRATLYIVKE